MLIVALCWMYFSKIDISVKSNGIFRSDGDIVDISNGVTGKVENVILVRDSMLIKVIFC